MRALPGAPRPAARHWAGKFATVCGLAEGGSGQPRSPMKSGGRAARPGRAGAARDGAGTGCAEGGSGAPGWGRTDRQTDVGAPWGVCSPSLLSGCPLPGRGCAVAGSGCVLGKPRWAACGAGAHLEPRSPAGMLILIFSPVSVTSCPLCLPLGCAGSGGAERPRVRVINTHPTPRVTAALCSHLFLFLCLSGMIQNSRHQLP